MPDFFSGVITVCDFAIGLFFLRFWRNTHDRLFHRFAVAFWILGVNRLLLLFIPTIDERVPVLYIVRLFAFVFILIAVVEKNFKR